MFLIEGSISCSSGAVIREILEASFQVLIYHPSIPRALHVIALALLLMLDEVKVPHLTRYYPSWGQESAIFQVHLGDFHTTSYLTHRSGISLWNIEGVCAPVNKTQQVSLNISFPSWDARSQKRKANAMKVDKLVPWLLIMPVASLWQDFLEGSKKM